MAEEAFIILERAGSGYIMKSTKGRGDTVIYILDILQALTSFGDDDVIEIETPFDAEEWSVVATGARIVRTNTSGINEFSPFATLKGYTVNTRSDTFIPIDRDKWIVHVSYTLADHTTDKCEVTVYATRSTQVSRSNITNN